MGWTPVALQAVCDWHLWLPLAGVLALCWGVVVVAAAALFGGATAGRDSRRFASPDRGAIVSGQPTQDESQKGSR